jgi:hypothetical protein
MEKPQSHQLGKNFGGGTTHLQLSPASVWRDGTIVVVVNKGMSGSDEGRVTFLTSRAIMWSNISRDHVEGRDAAGRKVLPFASEAEYTVSPVPCKHRYSFSFASSIVCR